MVGPNGFRNTVHEFEFRPGGRWWFTIHGPDGADYENDYVFVKVSDPERIVISLPDPKHSFGLTVVLAEEGEGTRLTWRMSFDSAEHCQQLKPFVTETNE